MGETAALLAYLLVGVVFGVVAYQVMDADEDMGVLRDWAAFSSVLFWPLALAVLSIAYVSALMKYRERLLIFSEEGRLRARARRARRDMRLLELRREAEAAEETYRRKLDRMIEEASR